jgi:2-dehydro-3-deoxygluconokinase
MTELVTFGETPLRFSTPDHERLETAERAEVHVDGKESNVAVAASCVGTDSLWLSTLPETPVGRRVVRSLRAHDIETRVNWTDAGRVGVAYHEAGADPRTAGWVQDRDGVSAAQTTPGDVPMDRIQSADVVFSGVSTPALSESAASST